MVRPHPYVPNTGHIVGLTFDPQAGHEEAGRRPAIVLSPASYNGLVGLAVVCPVTRRVRGFPFEVALPEGLAVHGVALADQVKNVDWRARQAKYLDTAPLDVIEEIRAKLAPLLGIEPA